MGLLASEPWQVVFEIHTVFSKKYGMLHPQTKQVRPSGKAPLLVVDPHPCPHIVLLTFRHVLGPSLASRVLLMLDLPHLAIANRAPLTAERGMSLAGLEVSARVRGVLALTR